MFAKTYRVIVIGVSAGGFTALKQLLGALPADFPLPIVVVQHQKPDPEREGMLPACLQPSCSLRLKEADEGEKFASGTVYFAPADYHLLIEQDASLALSVDAPVRFARPSIDILFESASEAYGEQVIGIILTGANTDGSAGLKRIKQGGGIAIVQDPDEAEVKQMPLSALSQVEADWVAPLDRIARTLVSLSAASTEEQRREAT